MSEQGQISEESEMEENVPSQSEERQESGNNVQDNQVKDDNVLCRDTLFEDTETTKQRSNFLKLLREKRQKRLSNTLSQQMVQILKENVELRKRKYKEENSILPLQSNTTSNLENLDDADLFFLSMAKMTKQMPKYEQAKIKLALSNSVLSTELRLNSLTSEDNSQNQVQTEPFYFQSSSSADSIHPIMLPSDHSSSGNEYSTNVKRPTLLEMTSLSNE